LSNLNYSNSEETVSGRMHDFVNGQWGSFPSLFWGAHKVRGPEVSSQGKFLKSAALQSLSKNCRAAAVGKNVTRRRVSRIILASVVNAAIRQCWCLLLTETENTSILKENWHWNGTVKVEGNESGSTVKTCSHCSIKKTCIALHVISELQRRHLSYGITQCYLPPDTGECTLP